MSNVEQMSGVMISDKSHDLVHHQEQRNRNTSFKINEKETGEPDVVFSQLLQLTVKVESMGLVSNKNDGQMLSKFGLPDLPPNAAIAGNSLPLSAGEGGGDPLGIQPKITNHSVSSDDSDPGSLRRLGRVTNEINHGSMDSTIFGPLASSEHSGLNNLTGNFDSQSHNHLLNSSSSAGNYSQQDTDPLSLLLANGSVTNKQTHSENSLRLSKIEGEHGNRMIANVSMLSAFDENDANKKILTNAERGLTNEQLMLGENGSKLKLDLGAGVFWGSVKKVGTNSGELGSLDNSSNPLIDEKLNQLSKGSMRQIGNDSVVVDQSKSIELPLPKISQPTQDTSSTMISSEGSQFSKTQGIAPKLAPGSEFTQGLNLRREFTPNLMMRIQWMFNQSLSSAEILMDPPELGPLSIKVKYSDGETNIVFQVANTSTKEALDENLPKLKHMLEQQGVQIGEAQVQQEKDNPESSEQERASTETEESDKDDTQDLSETSRHGSAKKEGVDLYS